MKEEKIEVMRFLANSMDDIIEKFLKKIDTNWQPADLLPISNADNFDTELKAFTGGM